MVTRQIRSIDIQEREDFDELLRSLQDHTRTTLTIDVATGVDVLSVPGEFEDLYVTAHTNDVEIELVTDDPLRQELARIYGMKAVPERRCNTIEFLRASTVKLPDKDPLDEGRTKARFPIDIDETTEITLTDSFSLPGELPDDRLSPFETGASFSFVTANEYADQPVIAGRPTRNRPARKPRTVSRSLGSSSIIVSALVVAAAVVVLLLSLLAPAATIAIVPETQPVSADVTYGLAGSGSELDLSVDPAPVSETLTFEFAAPATGETFVPDTPARGMIFLTNPHSEPIQLAAGTAFTSGEGATYLALEAIEIPAADPFESARFGTAVVGIEAVEPGPSGNLDTGELTGTLESGIMFQNRFPLEGGSLASVAVVTSSDLDALRTRVEAELATRMGSALDEHIPDGWMLVDAPQVTEDLALSYSAESGAIADEVSVVGEAVVAGQIYNPGELESAARDRLLSMLTSAVPEGFGLKMDSIQLSSPQPATDVGGPALTMTAEGSAIAQFGADFDDRLKDDLSGKSESYATSLLEQTPGIESFEVSYGPDWLPWEPIPRLSNRISVDVDGS